MLQSKKFRGLTVIEVLFAMVIILVGMVGIARMIPFASRQMEDSYKITQALAAGESALAVFHSSSVSQPSRDLPWQMVDDVFDIGNASIRDCDNPTSLGTFLPRATMSPSSMRALYESLNAVSASAPGAYFPGFQSVGSADLYQVRQNNALRQNNVIGTGFCIDPLFWGNQPRVATRIPRFGNGLFRRTRFPFYDEYVDPTDLTVPPTSFAFTYPGTPRLMRVSLRDPIVPSLAGWNGRNGWLNGQAAQRIATTSGGDIVLATIESNRQLGPIRGTRAGPGSTLIDSPNAGSFVSWMATLTPSESTPYISPLMLPLVNLGVTPTMVRFPELYDLSVVVYGRRSPRLDAATTIPLASERIATVAFPSLEHLTSGSFDIVLNSDASADMKVRVGDWMMLSRHIFTLNSSGVWTPIRQRHRWYRAVSVSGASSSSIQVRVTGAPWNLTEEELTFGIPPTLPTTAALVSDVVQVYERTVELKID